MRKLDSLNLHDFEGKKALRALLVLLCCCCFNYSAIASKTDNYNSTSNTKSSEKENLPSEKLFNCSITGNLSICQGGSTQLCAPAGMNSYLWSNGITTQCVTINTAGNYSVTYSNLNGTTVCNQNVTLSIPNCAIKTLNNSICFYGGSAELCSEPGYSGWLWSTGATTECITVTTGGTYTLTVTNSNGCTSSCTKIITVIPPPNCTITGNNFCVGYSSQLCAPAGVGTYLWSTGATTQCITVSTAGTYTVTVTDGNGCTSSCSKSLTTYTPPTCNITGSLFYCQGSSTQICATAGLASYIWSTGATTQCITVTAGDYTVTITDGNGCTSSCTVKITQRQNPVCSITGNAKVCPGGSTQWCAAAAPVGYTYTYLWTGGATTQCRTINAVGTYTVTITDQYGCSSSCTKSLTNYTLPTCAITGNGSVCPGGSTQWCAATNSAYLWSTGATTQCITVSAAGAYTVTVTNANGCTKSCSKSLTTYTPPTCVISGSLFYCAGSSTQICATANAAYLWSTGATTQCITVTQGDYTVTVTNGNGCTSSCTAKVSERPNPVCSITGNDAVCQGNSAQWCAAAAPVGYTYSYLWNTAETTQCITVSTAGTYTVTITDQYGCSSSCSKSLTNYTPPTCNITGSLFYCAGSSTQICAPAGLASYVWSTGATTQCVTVTAGDYTVTVTDANGCSSSCTAKVTERQNPVCSITGTGIVCPGGSAQWCAAAAPVGYTYSYLWSTAATTQCITVSTVGTYTVTITDQYGCSSSCSKSLTNYTPPTCNITGSLFYCQGSSTQICATAGLASYIWSTGATTQCITVTAGDYTVTITDGNGCTSSCTVKITQRQNPVCSITGNAKVCPGGSTQWCAAAAPVGYTYTYLWTGGATTQCRTINAVGTYTVTITDQYGCSSSCTKSLRNYTLPTCAITGNGSVCPGGSTQWCAATNSAYLWSTGATTQCITVSAAGAYTVTVTNANGCTKSCSKSLTTYTPPTCVISGSLFYCAGSSTQICATANAAYLWSTGATTQCITVTQGDYTVTVTNGNGCTSSCTAKVSERPNPVCSITGNDAVCQGNSAQWCAAAAPVGYTYSYLWSTAATTQCITVSTAGTYTVTITDQYGCSSSCSKSLTNYTPPTCFLPSISIACINNGLPAAPLCGPAGVAFYLWSTGETTQCINVSTAGSYTLTVTDVNGCTGSCSTQVVTPLPPSCSITGNGSVCQGGSVEWCTVTNSAYLWSTGATTQCITVSTAGTYTVTVTDGNGCTSSCSKSLTTYSPPTCNITGSLFYCQGSSTQICATAGLASYIWSTGATTQCITVTAGDYTVTITDGNGCTSSCTVKITQRQNPVCSITGNAKVCPGGSTQWCAAAAPVGYTYTYLWTGGATTQCRTINAVGTYTVTITDQYGCSSSCTKSLTNYTLPTCAITGNGSVCPGGSTQWCAATNSAYLWSTGATTQCITVSAAGAYTVTVTNANGCTKSCSKSLTTYTPPTCVISGSLFYCAGSSTQICATANAAYLWSTGATTQCITVTQGDYTVTVTNGNGCTSSCTAKVSERPNPVCSITGNDAVCQGNSAQWCAAAAPVGYTYSYLWNTAETTQCITVSTAGTYTVTITDQYGCSSSCSKSLTNYTPPTCNITGSLFYCAGSSTQICAPAGLASYVWSTGATTQCVTVNAGDYTVTVTDANGCSSSCTAKVTERQNPVCSITGTGIVCPNGSAQWCAAAAPVGYTYSYLWSTAATTQCITVSTVGTYTVTITDQYGCSSSCSKSLTNYTPPTCNITGSLFYCQGSSTQICATAGLASYIWSTGATTQCITVTAGDYTVTITDGNGCTSSCTVKITQRQNPVCSITGNAKVCPGGSTQWCAAAAPVGYTYTYLWTGGATTQCRTINAVGTYTVTITDQYGCSSSCTKSLTNYTLPTCAITGNGSVCPGGSTQWCAATNSAYLWSTGATTQCITVSAAGAYTVTVTNANGCTKSCSKSLTIYTPPTCNITGSLFYCAGSSTQICAPAGLAAYIWNTGATTQCITVTQGDYTVTVTNGNGCTSSCTAKVSERPNPVCSITGNDAVCQGNSAQWCAAAAPVGYTYSYLWNTAETTQCITVSTAGTYTVTITDQYGCSSSCSKSLTVYTPPTCNINGSLYYCQGSSTQICAPAGLASYVWSTGATTQCVTVTAGDYTVTVTDANGCSSSCTAKVTERQNPVCSITGTGIVCPGGSAQWCAAVAPVGYTYSYLWSTAATTQCITVSTVGTYTVTITDQYGCSSSCTKSLTNYTPPTCVISGSLFYCAGSSTQICAPAGLAAYIWNTGATTQCITVTAGDYTVTVTDANGCTSSCTAKVTERQNPVCSITGTGIVCIGGSAQWCAAVAPVGYTYSYLWSTSATTQCVTVSTVGTYTVTITDQYGCSSSCTKSLTNYTPPTCVISGSLFYCAGSSTQICAPAGLAAYIWNTGATTQCITVTAGDYTVTVTDANGCSSSCTAKVTERQNPVCSITGTGIVCPGGSAQWCAAVAPVGYTYSYLWSTSATTQCVTVSTVGTYTVTITDQYGCSSSCSKSLTNYTPPTCAISGSLFYCAGGSTQICAPAGLAAYIWNTGATTQCITVTAGDYTVTVTDANGCTSSCTAKVTERQNPVCSITGNNFCYGYSSQVCAAAAPVGYTYSYLWSTAATTQCITTTVGGTFTVTITDQYGCSSSCSKTIVAYTPPTCSITGSNFCLGSSSQLCASTNASYLWSTAATTQCITVTTGGTYTVTVTDGNGCTSSCSKTVIAYTPPTCVISGSLFYCAGSSTQICAPAGLAAYIWNTGATTQCITVTAGDYTVTVTDVNGCSSSCTAKVTERQNPVCSITGNNFCYGYSSQVCASTAPLGYTYSYLWSTAATTQCITTTVGGTFTVTITDQYGCSSSCSKTIVAYTPPTCSITGSNFCLGSSSQLCASTNASYLWSTAATTQCITVTTGGTYTVTVTDGNGCTSSCSKTVIAYTPPTCMLPSSTVVCSSGLPPTLCAPAGFVGYIWNTGATNQCIGINAGGFYTVTVTDGNGCSASCSTNVLYTTPNCTITGDNFCYGISTQLCVATNAAYLWSTGATTQCITVTTGGTYIVTVTDGNGCTASCSKTIVAYTPPTCSITGSNFCLGSSSQLCASTNASYLWSTAATTQCITVTTGGTYTVTVTDGNGCTSSCSKTVIAYTPPTCVISGSLFYCAGGSTQICAPAGLAAYIWNTGATTQCITVTAGDYTVTVTDANGCTSSCTAKVTERQNPVCSITGNNFCYGYSSQVCAAAAPVGYTYSYLWSTAATTQCITTTVGGTFTVTITDQYGCSSSCSKTIVAYTPPTCSITGSNFCLGSSSQLCASTNASYLWSTAATTQCITVTTGGTYTVTVTDGNGCTSSCSKTVIAYTPPTCVISGSLFYCAGSSTQICAPAGLAAYIWNTGATTQCITVTAGDYTVTVTDANGCSSSCTAKVTERQNPVCSITGNNFCYGYSSQVCAAAAPVGYTYSYLWSTAETTQCITTTVGGTFTVTITDQYGCSSSCSKTIVAYTPPTCSITGSNFCLGSSSQLCASTNASYLWSTAATTQCITVTTGGTYTVTVTDGNGCTSSCSKTVIAYTPPTCVISGSLFYCAGSSTQICAPAGLAAYIWNTGATTQCITVTAGDYTVTVTDANGCSSSCTAKVTERQNPVCSITGNNFCYGYSSQVCAAAAPVGYTYSYLWSTAETTQCITTTVGGTFTVTITDQHGCSSSCSKTIVAYTPPTCSITGSNFCLGSSSQLCASTNASYLWSTAATTQCITVTTGGTYTVTVTDGNGCTSSCSKTVIAYTPPTCVISGSLFYCAGSSTQICAPAGLAAYIWNTGATTQCITVTAGDYTVTVTDANGCSSSCTAKVTERQNPVCSITGDNFCYGNNSLVCAAIAPVGYAYGYIWSTGETTQCLITTTGGTYTVTITDQYGCSSSCSKTIVAYTPPTCSITGSNFCLGYSSQLCASTNASYLWSTAATTQCITVTTGGTYTVTVTDGNGCTSSCSKTVIAYTPPTCAITGDFFYCAGSSTQICAPAGLAAYIWNTGATTQCITVTAGDYTVTVTDVNGCSSSCTAKVTERQNPVCSITGNNFCYGYSSQVCASTAPVGYTYSYLWSTAATTQCIITTVGGTFTVTITDQYGCSSSCSKTIVAYTPPTCSITGSNFCLGSSSQLCASTNASYLWSTAATTQCITVTTGGTYTVTVYDANGCTSSCSKTVIAYTPPTCAITGDFFYCAGSSTQICAPAGLAAYIWNTGATTQCITVTAGDYTVTVTDVNGCSSSCTAKVTERQNPVCSITGNGAVCYGGSAQWCAATAPVGYTYSYSWSTGATTQCIVVNTAGTYTVTITDQYGCSSSCSQSLTNYTPPTCAITGDLFYCLGGSTQICAPSGLTAYIWNTGATTQCITVSAGDYTVTVTDGNGCTSSCTAKVTARQLPICSITGNSISCPGSSTQWCAVTAPVGYTYSYLWSTGETTQCASISAAGTYTVTITDQYGCSSSCNKSLTNYTPPTCFLPLTTVACNNSSPAPICAPNGFVAYLWSTGATTQCVNVITAGFYTVTVTDANGCTGSCSTNVINPTPPNCTITGNGIVCEGGSAQWCASAGLNFTYLWSTGASTQCITVAIVGNYTVTVSDPNGCSSVCDKSLTNYTPPSCAITGNQFYCTGGNTQICAPAGLTSYIWNTGATTECITVTAGDYTVTVTDANGCSSSCTAKVTERQNPACSITGNGSVCQGGSTQWCAAIAPVGYTYSYSWSSGATTQCITVTAAGTYTVTVTDQYGCSSSCTKSLTTYTPPTCAISGNLFYCAGGNTQICAPVGLTGYLWNTGATSQCITVTAGDYTVTVTDANGCSSSCTAKVTERQNPVCSIIGNGSVCQGGSTQWCAAIAPVGYTYSYSWSSGATTQCITVTAAGTYTVTVTDQYGCSSSCTKSLTTYTPPTCAISGNLFYCAGSNTQICAPAGLTGYLWNTGATTQCITVSAGDYTVTVTNGNGCTSSCTAKVTARQVPVCSVTGNSSICSGGSTLLCGATAPVGYTYTYLWNGGATTQCRTISAAGTYTVTITDQYGCTSSCTKSVTISSPPSCAITGNRSICPGGSTQLCAPAGTGFTYLWSNGATTQCRTITAAGVYYVTVTNSTGCTSSCSACVTISYGPSCNITGNSTICNGGSTQLCAPSGTGYTYLWSNGATTQCRTVTAAGNYTVTVTNSSGCSSTCSKCVTISSAPSCAITGNNSCCYGGNVQLCASSGTGYTYLWNNGATTQCRTVTASGTYTVTITNCYGCTSSCTKTVTVNTPPSCTITGNTSICSGGSTQLCAPSGTGLTYVWSNGATTQCRTITAAGTYYVTVTNSSGCSSSCSVCVTTSSGPSCNITGNSTICNGGSTQLCAPSGTGYTYLWNNGATTQCRTVTAAGNYTVTVTNSSGCSSTCSKCVTISSAPSCAITGNNSCCYGGNVQLCASSGTGYTYLWNNGATTQCRTVTASGIYTVTITNCYGCTSSCTKAVTVNTPPSCTITGNTIICSGGSTQLCAPSGAGNTYVWSNGATTQCRTITAAGTYYVTVTNSSGCSSSCSVCVTTGSLSVSITGNTSICSGGSTQLCASAGTGYTYLWNNGATTQCRTVTATGNYTVTVTNGSGCSATKSVCVISSTPPSCTITGSSTCGSTAVQICAPSGSGYTYLWNNGATTQCRNVYAGTYTVTVTNAAGCSSVCSKTVTSCTPPSCSISGNSTCGSNSIQICAPSGTGYTYLWNNGATTQCRYVYAGTYTVTVTNSSGCTSSCTKCVYPARTIESTVTNEGGIEVSAYPNPFYETSTIEFTNTKANSHVVIELYDMRGMKVANLFEKDVEQGVTYQAKVDAGNLAEGIYIYRLISGDNVINGRLTLIK